MSENQNWRVVGPVLVRRPGRAEEAFASIDEAIRGMGWPIVHSIVDDLRRAYVLSVRSGRAMEDYGDRFRLVDDYGLSVPAWRIEQEIAYVDLERCWHDRLDWPRRGRGGYEVNYSGLKDRASPSGGFREEAHRPVLF